MRNPKKTCSNGHTFYKTTDCPTCPKCEALRIKSKGADLPKIGAPATRALGRIGVECLSQLVDHSENDLLALHGFGQKALGILKSELKSRGLSLRKA